MHLQELEVRRLVEQAHCEKQRACDDVRLALEASAAQTEEEISHRMQDLRAMVQRKDQELEEHARAEHVEVHSHRLASRSVLYWALHHWQRQADQQYQVRYALHAIPACACGRSLHVLVARCVANPYEACACLQESGCESENVFEEKGPGLLFRPLESVSACRTLLQGPPLPPPPQAPP